MSIQLKAVYYITKLRNLYPRPRAKLLNYEVKNSGFEKRQFFYLFILIKNIDFGLKTRKPWYPFIF